MTLKDCQTKAEQLLRELDDLIGSLEVVGWRESIIRPCPDSPRKEKGEKIRQLLSESADNLNQVCELFVELEEMNGKENQAHS